jgi:hypothetical protein
MHNYQKGFIYIATGTKYLDEAIFSVAHLKKHHPDVPIAIITDDPIYVKNNTTHFDCIIKVDNPFYSWRDKLLIRNTPFEKTIFVDTDTLCIMSMYELFDLLDNFEMLIHSNAEGYQNQLNSKYANSAFPEFNTGLICYRKTHLLEKRFFELWEEEYIKYENLKLPEDQVSFRVLIATGLIKYCWIPAAYNFFIYFPAYTAIPVRLVHGRPFEKLEEIGKKINETHKLSDAWNRTYYTEFNQVIYAKMNLADSFELFIKIGKLVLMNIGRIIKKNINK